MDIIKHKKYPFFGYQGHPEVDNTKLFLPFITSVYENFNNKQLNKNNKKYNSFEFIKLKSRKVSCKKYKLAQTTKYGKCLFYKTSTRKHFTKERKKITNKS